MTDELEQRLRAADPAPLTGPIDPARSPRAQALVEHTMTSTDDPIPLDHRRAPSRRPLALVAAAAAVVLVVVGAAVVLGGDDEDAEPAVALRAEYEDPTVMGSCIALSPDTLRDGAELAFRGTVTSVDGHDATLSVSTWYLGGSADEVTVTGPAEVETALLGAVPLEQGGEYLIVAADGVVRSCGQSGEATPDLEAVYESAFG